MTRCPTCGHPGTDAPCTPACTPICPTCAHTTLAQAHSPTPGASGQVVYVVCGWQGCPQRRVVPVALWETEMARRASPPQDATPKAPAGWP
jgi:hypothetical protein